MASPTPRPYTVHRPGPLQRIDENLWGVVDDVPGIPGARRRMLIVRRADGGLLFFNAIPVPDATLAEIRALGRSAHLIIPNRFHALDAPAFAARLGVEAFSPAVGLEAVRARQAARAIDELPPDPTIEVVTVDGFKTGETALLVRTGARTTLITADLITNAPHGRGVTGLFMRLMGFTGAAPKLPAAVRMRVLADKPAVRGLLERLAATAGLMRIAPSHGAIFDGDVPTALRAIAQSV